MATTGDAIRVTGLVEFQRALKTAETASPRELRLALNDAAAVVVVAARKRAPRRTGRLAGSIRATSQQRAAVVSEGGARVPYAGFIDYGGHVGRHDSVSRPVIREGRILYPAFRDNRSEVQKVLAKSLSDLVDKAGLNG